MSVSRFAAAALMSSVLVLTAVAPALGHDLAPEAPTPPQDARVPLVAVHLQPGDVVRDNGVAVTVPDPGSTVWGELKFADGSFQELQVETGSDGVVKLYGLGDEAELQTSAISSTFADPSAAETTASGASYGECSDRSHSLFSWRYSDFRWRFNQDTLPGKFASRSDGQEQVLRALQRANQNITRADNLCGRDDLSGAQMEYVGITSRLPDISAGAYCASPDGVNVIAFGDLPSRSIAYACVHSDGSRRGFDGDIKINREWSWETRLRLCNRELLIEAGMTHEFGHIYGLAHVGGASLTMQPIVSYCSRSHASLGLGDMLGLERKY